MSFFPFLSRWYQNSVESVLMVVCFQFRNFKYSTNDSAFFDRRQKGLYKVSRGCFVSFFAFHKPLMDAVPSRVNN